MTPNILYRDENWTIVDKPSGLSVHRARLESKVKTDSEIPCLQRVRDMVGHMVYPVHRLDRATSGVLVFANSSEAAALLASAFAERSVHKEYLALVRGWAPEAAEIDYALAEDATVEKKAALTRVLRLHTVEISEQVSRFPTTRYSLVSARPVTGRYHQIRKHLEHLRHPIIGDTTYGEGRHNRFFRERFGIDRLMLFARRIEFVCPITKEKIVGEAPIPKEFQELFLQWNWH